MDAVVFPKGRSCPFCFILIRLGLVWLDLVLCEIGLKATYVLFRSWVLDWTKVDNDAYIPKVRAKF